MSHCYRYLENSRILKWAKHTSLSESLLLSQKPLQLHLNPEHSKITCSDEKHSETTYMALLQEPDEFNILSGDEYVILDSADDDPSPPYKKHKRVHWSQDLVEIFYFVPTNSNVIPPFTAEYCGTAASRKSRQRKARRTASSLTRSAGQISTVMVMRGLQFITKQLNDLTVGSVSEDRSRRWDELLQLYMIRERLKDEKGDWV